MSYNVYVLEFSLFSNSAQNMSLSVYRQIAHEITGWDDILLLNGEYLKEYSHARICFYLHIPKPNDRTVGGVSDAVGRLRKLLDGFGFDPRYIGSRPGKAYFK